MRKKLILLLVIGLIFPSLVRANNGHYKKKGPVGIGGWVVFWDANNASLVSFEKHADQTDRAYCEWYNLQKDCMPHPVDSATEPLKARAVAAAKKNGVELWMMVGNYNLAINDHDKNFVEPFLYDGAMRAKHIQALIDFAVKDGVQGIQIDYENFLAKDKDAFSNFMAELDKACKAHGFMCGVALPAKYDPEGTWDDPQSRDYKAIGKVTDQFVPMTYDYHWATGTAGCVTSPEWSERVVKYAVTTLDADKMEVGYPTYGYDWVGKVGETITYKEFMARAAKYNVTPIRDTQESQELYIDYTDEKGQAHEAWMPDARSLEYQCDIVKKYHLYGIGIWMFGSEDESFWTTMKKVNSTDKLTSKLLPDEPASAPVKLKLVKFLTDDKETGYQYAYPETSKIAVLYKQGKRWIDIKLQGNAWSGAGMGVDKVNLLPYLSKGALQFYIRGNKGGETLSGIGFVMDTGLGDDEKIHYENSVPLGNYCNVTTKWQLVTIPLSDFPSSGHHFDDRNGQAVTGPFKWAKVIEFDLDHAPGSDPDFEIQFSNVRVIPSYKTKLVLKEKRGYATVMGNTTTFNLLQVEPQVKPPLDEVFRPAFLAHKHFAAAVQKSGQGVSLKFALERSGNQFSVFATQTFPDGHAEAKQAQHHAERILKFLLWQRGSGKIYVLGPSSIVEHLKTTYSANGSRSFDANFMMGVYERASFEIIGVSEKDFPQATEVSSPVGRHLGGCRIGFDAGGSDRKVAAVIDGKEVFSSEVVWEPKLQNDPMYHFNGVDDSIRLAMEHLPRLDAIGVSSAGIFIDNKTRVASLFRKVPTDLFDKHIKTLYLDIAKKWGNVPIEVANDGDVTALAGAMSLNVQPVLGIAMGTSQAVGYVDEKGHITGWLNELAFAPVDYADDAPVDHEWSGDKGTGVQYFSQDAVIRLAPKAGIELDSKLSPGDKLKIVQNLLKAGDKRPLPIFETIGIYLGYALAQYAEFYNLQNVLILGRVTSGEGGTIILENAQKVLKTEAPHLSDKIKINLPDEASRRVGQAIAAASLPALVKG